MPTAAIAKYGPVAERGTSWATPERWVGNGPFVLASWHRGQEIAVARSPTYWDAAQVRLREIHFHAFDSIDAEERAFRAGQLHVTETIPPGRIDSYRRDSPGLLRIDPLLGTYFVRVNVRRPGLGDPRVRLALALALDRTAIVEKILRGGQTPAYTFTPPGLERLHAAAGPGTEPRGREAASRARRPPAARASRSSRSSTTTPTSTARWRRRCRRCGGATSGSRSGLVNEDLKSVEEARRTGAYDLLLSSWIADYADPSAFLDVFRSDSGDNFTGWSSGEYDASLSKAARTADPSERNALYQAAERVLLGEAPVIPLYHYTHVFLIRPSVKGWHPTLLDHHPYKDVWLGD